jgi:hypothetical protein
VHDVSSFSSNLSTPIHIQSLAVGIMGLTELVLAASLSSLFVLAIFPWVGILTKWVLVGRYSPGLHRNWGSFYLRWWLTRQVVSIMGRGAFNWSSCMLTAYYRLMGARIGKGVHIHRKADLGEFDLIDIGDGAWISDR